MLICIYSDGEVQSFTGLKSSFFFSGEVEFKRVYNLVPLLVKSDDLKRHISCICMSLINICIDISITASLPVAYEI